MNKPWRIILSPFSAIYAIVLALRHELYDSHILPISLVDIPTICVGNLAIGGTGKTPMVEYLIRLISNHYRVAVLSRGYGRRTRGFRLAGAEDTAWTLGDELMQMHRHFPDIPMAACRDRVEGIHRLQQAYPDLQVVLLDDAFQYRSLQSGFSLLLTTADNPYVDDHLLPWGSMRDLSTRAHHANVVIVTKCPPSMHPIDKRVLMNKLHLPPYQKLFFSHIVSQPLNIDAKRPMLVTGIADPHPLINELRTIYPNLYVRTYADHHIFNKVDVAQLLKLADKHDVVYTTEKDYERLALTSLPATLGERLVVIPMEVDIESDAPELERLINNYISETLRLHNR